MNQFLKRVLLVSVFCGIGIQGWAAGFNSFKAFDHPYPNIVLVVAHRCGYRSEGKNIFSENSIPAIKHSIKIGVDILEVDVRLTSDLVPVIMHDSTVNRTTTGKGKVSSFTLAEIKNLHLKGNNPTERIPTLEEVMRLAKGKILVNMDKVSISNIQVRSQIMDVLIKTGTVDHAIFKGGASLDEIKQMKAEYPKEKIIYMPVLGNKSEEKVMAVMKNGQTPAVELIFNNAKTPMLSDDVQKIAKQEKVHIWVNTLWNSLCAGKTDGVALKGDPDGSWGWVIEHGTTIIQTDNADQLISYLEKKGLRGKK